MVSFVVSETELKEVARRAGGRFEYNGKGFVLISYGSYGQHHIRLDLVKWPNGRFNKLRDDNSYEFQVSSFHVKRETYYSREEQDYDYLYFVYVGAGVWQPVWGYSKTEKLSGASRRWEFNDRVWSENTHDARLFLEDLSKATRTEQALATGPVQGAASNLSGIL
ncbi:MAG: hypothetical protein IRZ04_11195 [Rhodospirillales bacterium]|nr:hypothetical protein [Rhodospirillales bacterium]